ncbi:MAG: aminotransferase class I/II-fold pyridoxal phosphate-dependent enzyme [Bacteroidales bacterium]|nr:aminotransferase class I/II-fold pyridoxal phosphate-dependent enzyme [Bacteroidales bacterium]NLO68738.1 aminotransferase class I/II-fold pyridoxal phosphate-dependent enzyme [Bacteroidales bacterium]
MTDLLRKAYDPEEFRQQAHRLVDLIANHLKDSYNQKLTSVLPWKEPDERLEHWRNELETEFQFDEFWQDTIEETIHIHHPRYMGHQVCASIPIAGLSEMLNGALNNGSAIYEMGPVSTAMERVVTDWLAKAIGFDEDSAGILTSGGSLGNLTALLAARQSQAGYDLWQKGHQDGFHPALMVSAEAHYSVARAVQLMGWGEQGVIKVPTDNHFRLDPSQLDACLNQAREQGLSVIAVVGNACSTSTGTYDPLTEIAEFCRKNNLWFHVDGAHGGAAAITPKYQHLTRGIELADSVVIDFHKMLGISALTTAVLFREGHRSYDPFNQKAVYILHEKERELWFNSAVRTLECTKNMMGIKVYSILRTYGPQVFIDYLTTCYDLGKEFSTLISQSSDFELPYEPETNIVCFRWIDPSLPLEEIDRINADVRKTIIESGQFYIVQTKIMGRTYLRTCIMNPLTTRKEMEDLLHLVSSTAEKFSGKNK